MQFFLRYAHSAGLARSGALRRLYKGVYTDADSHMCTKEGSPTKSLDLEWLNMRPDCRLSYFSVKKSVILTKNAYSY